MPLYSILKIGLLLILIYSCVSEPVIDHSSVETEPFEDIVVVPKKTNSVIFEPITDTTEFYVDSLTIGKSKSNRIEIRKISNQDSTYTNIKFFKKSNQWKLIQELNIENSAISPLTPKYADYNNDGFMDVLFRSGSAARGANIVQTLLVYNKSDGKMIWIKNSEQYPNIEYNAKRDCIISWIFTGSLSTAFLRIESDSLKEFAYIEQGDGRVRTYLIDKQGDSKLLNNIKDVGFSDYEKFIDYDPLTVWKE